MKLLLTGLAGMTLTVAGAAEKPNIIVIMADDCRWQDLGCYGSPDAITPNIDRLASEGLKFNRFYQAVAMSSPTRHCFMTGLYPVKSGAYPNHTMVKEGTRSVVHYLRDCGYRVALQGKRHIAPQSSFPYEYLGPQRDDIMPERIEEFVTDAAEKKQPFFLFVGSHDPHEPWTRGDRSQFHPEHLTLPPFLVDTPETREAYCAYLAEINLLDSNIGKVDEVLKKHGLQENTIFIFTSEQGFSFPFAKWTCYEAGLHTGFIIRWPQKVKAGTTTDAMCEYVDVVPTLVEIAGGKPADGLDGKSFLPVILGKKKQHKEYVYAEQTSRGINGGPEYYGIRTVRNERYRYILNLSPEATFKCMATHPGRAFWESWKAKQDDFARQQVERYQKRPAEELYDVVNDPYEMHNLIGDPKYTAVLQDLKAKLQAWMTAQGDKGQATEMNALEHMAKNAK